MNRLLIPIALITALMLAALLNYGNNDRGTAANPAPTVEQTEQTKGPASTVREQYGPLPAVPGPDTTSALQGSQLSADEIAELALEQHTQECEVLAEASKAAKKITAELGWDPQLEEAFGLTTFTSYALLDDRPRVGAFRVNDIVARKLEAADNSIETRLRILATYIDEMIKQGVDADVAFTAARTDEAHLRLMLGERDDPQKSLAELLVDVALDDLDPVNTGTTKAPNHVYADDVQGMLRSAAQEGRRKLDRCTDA